MTRIFTSVKMHALLARHGVIVVSCVAATSCAFFGAQLRLRTFLFLEGRTIPDYQKMYTTLFNAITDALEEIQKQNIGLAQEQLMAAQQKTEEIYIES